MGQKSLNLQLQRIGVCDSTECISTFEDDYTKFRTSKWLSPFSKFQRRFQLYSCRISSGVPQKFNPLGSLLVWAEQGDEVSLQYAGTYALKGDLVRYGKQTMTGAIKDGLSAMSRYYLNNFQDGVRQDALDLISGRYTVGTHSPSQLQPIGSQPSFLPVASALLIGGVTVTSFTIHQAGRNTQQYLASALWAGVTAGVVAMIKANGRHLTSRPRLCHLI
ncbi:hypothetical protein AXX17_AT3G46210 [Arabidopsis thaliana]|uniref:SAC domain-containing protein n=1 Tax=Arabidopsis thaliana TaxID=3702 RepID=A0A178VAZ6_ARATH|nr:hypothetical protein AXX17_AT3G46210 [Arabidopsis thaliana]